MAQEMLIHPQPSESDDYMGTSENCEFCMSVMLVWHSEGVTCLHCSRVSSNVYHTNHSTIPCDNTPEQIKSHKEIIHEITSRVGVSKNIIDRSVQLFILAKIKFKAKSIADLTLISIFQSYCEHRKFISFYRLKEYYFTPSNISGLNDLFHKLISCGVFTITKPFTYSEISNGLFSYFRIPGKYIDIINLLYTNISKILKYDSIQIRLGCAIQSLSSKNMFYDFICTHELLHFLCVRKNTIMVKLRKYKKILLNQNILNNV